MRHREFSVEDFQGLVNRLKAEAIVRLTVALARQFLGPVSLPCFDEVCIPGITAAPDGWACFGMPFVELLLAGTLAKTIDRLGTCPVTRNGAWYGIHRRPGYGKLDGAIIRGDSADVSVAVSLTPERLQITVRWAGPLPDNTELHLWHLISNYAARQSVRYQAGKPL